jgi:hypothetical protein
VIGCFLELARYLSEQVHFLYSIINRLKYKGGAAAGKSSSYRLGEFKIGKLSLLHFTK